MKTASLLSCLAAISLSNAVSVPAGVNGALDRLQTQNLLGEAERYLIELAPGETRTATFQLRRKDVSLWSTEKQLWYIPEGTIQLQVGASSMKLPLVRCLSS